MPPANNNSNNNDDLPPPKADFSAPPPYEATDNINHQYGQPQEMAATVKLPTYEEVQMEKMINHELPIPPGSTGHMQPPPPPSITGLPLGGRGVGVGPNGTGPAVTFIAIDADGENINADNSLLGTDIVFVTAFLVAFLFNWIGFLMLTCFCHTIAARYGALSGFGLSLAKWTLIVKHSTDFASHENSWLWWLIMAFGFLICVRALVQYISIKRTWRLLSTSAQERLLFFY
uniref:Putative golgi-associated protein/nedd4 ww domain-binding protein n=1 Tax=Culex tarsalis TaxID=7177 RepID=A0A1Q3FFQ1_CULTA